MTWGLLPWWSDSRRCRPPDCPRSHGWLPAAVVAALAAAGLPVAVVILARPVTLPKRPDSWPRRMPLTRGPWPMLPRPCGRPPGLCLMPKPPNSALPGPAAALVLCGRPNRTALECAPATGCRQTSSASSSAALGSTRLLRLTMSVCSRGGAHSKAVLFGRPHSHQWPRRARKRGVRRLGHQAKAGGSAARPRTWAKPARQGHPSGPNCRSLWQSHGPGED